MGIQYCASAVKKIAKKVWHPTSGVVAVTISERAVHEAVRMKPKVQWRPRNLKKPEIRII